MMAYKIGQVVQGSITGIKPYGAFVKIDEHTSGMIHISEISDNYVNNVNYFLKQGEKVVVKIIDIDKEKNQLKLSLKAIQPSRRNSSRTTVKVISSNDVIGFKSLEERLPQWIKEETEYESWFF